MHGCALFSNSGELLYFIEDVGRHNAVDAIAGLMWLDGVSGDDKVFYTTGRLTSEMVIKGAQMGIPFLLSRSGTTQMGHMVAERVGMSLLARCTGKHFLLLAGHERLVFEPELLEAAAAAPRSRNGACSTPPATPSRCCSPATRRCGASSGSRSRPAWSACCWPRRRRSLLGYADRHAPLSGPPHRDLAGAGVAVAADRADRPAAVPAAVAPRAAGRPAVAVLAAGHRRRPVRDRAAGAARVHAGGGAGGRSALCRNRDRARRLALAGDGHACCTKCASA